MQKFFQAPWQLKDLYLICSITFLLVAGAIFCTQFLPQDLLTHFKSAGIITIILGMLSQWIIMLLPLALVTARKYKLKFSHLGFAKISVLKVLFETIRGYLLYIGISILIGIFILYTNIKIPGYQVQERILPLFNNSNIDLTIGFLIIVIIAPIVEEIFFRGFIMRTLVDRVGKYSGSILSAVLFAAFHFQFQSIVPLFILGMILSGITLRTRSIWAPIGFHVFNNAIAFTFELLIVKDVISLDKVL